MELRECKICGEKYRKKDFPKAGVQNGITFYRHKCKQCYYKSKQERRQSIRSWFRDYKKGVVCQDCGINDYRVIEFHHIDQNKDFDLAYGAIRGYSIKKLKNEIAKCIPLCANCHRIRHFNE